MTQSSVQAASPDPQSRAEAPCGQSEISIAPHHLSTLRVRPTEPLRRLRAAETLNSFVSRHLVAKALAKCGLSRGTFATSKPPRCRTPGHSGARLPHGSFEWPYVGFLVLLAARAD